MTNLFAILFPVLLVVVTAIYITPLLFKNKKMIEIMLFGIGIIIAGSVFVRDMDLEGIGYILVLVGLSFLLGGFVKKSS
ncbi:UNVERIFIED_CONTAM: hypothetical protein Cloal_2245 [Acetivibrio alkalicellulosi]